MEQGLIANGYGEERVFAPESITRAEAGKEKKSTEGRTGADQVFQFDEWRHSAIPNEVECWVRPNTLWPEASLCHHRFRVCLLIRPLMAG